MDEWGQVELMELLMRYTRYMLARPIERDSGEMEEEVDKDLQLLLTCSEPLFQSRNPAVSPFFHVYKPRS
jgi:AP-3 complex subunit beta